MNIQGSVHSERGFTLIEVMMMVTLIGILGSMAIFQIGSARPAMVADGAMRTVMGQLNLARETAVAQRRQVDVICDEDKQVLRLIRRNLPEGTTLLAETPFESGVRYGLPESLPEDTPDKFGKGAEVYFAAAQSISFNSDGMLIDGGGSPVNGTIFLMLPKQTLSLRAVTVLGSIGRVRGYRWNGVAWTRA
jgi:prepilin-type N-terminal cleavage/methylation domain-containing protein